MLNALQYVDALGAGEWVHLVVMADSHYTRTEDEIRALYPSASDETIDNMMSNWNHSGAIVKLLMSTGLFDKFLHLGDVVDNGKVEYLNTAIDQIGSLNGQMLYAVGNHEAAGSNAIGDRLHNAFMSNLDNVNYCENFDSATYKNPLYTYKDDTHKIVYIHYPIWWTDMNNTDKLAWFWDAVNSVPDGYTMFLLSHAPIGTDFGVLNKQHVEMAFSLLPSEKRVGLFLAGHMHIDTVYEFTGGQCLDFLWDARGAGGGLTKAEREKGTEFEQSIRILSIGLNGNDRIKVYGIGAHASAQDGSYPSLFDMTSHNNNPNDAVNTSLGTTGLFTETTNTDVWIRKNWFAVTPNSYYYIFNPDTDASTKDVIIGEYADKRADAFVSGSRKYVDTGGIKELNVYKLYTRDTTNYLVVGSGKGETYTKGIVVTANIPQIESPIENVGWVSGNVSAIGIPSYSDTSTQHVTDRPISVEPSSSYVLTNLNAEITGIYIGRAKSPCAVNAVNGTRDSIDRLSGSSLPFPFETSSETNYIYICYSGTANDDTWTLTKV